MTLPVYDDSTETGTDDSFFASAPLNLPQRVASPPDALAIR